MAETTIPAQAKTLHLVARKAYEELFHLIMAMRELALENKDELAKASTPDEPIDMTELETLTNTVYCVRTAFDLIEDLKKELNALHEQYQSLACVRWVQECGMNEADARPTIQTPYAIGTPKIRQISSIPTRKKDPEGFAKLMQYLEVPEDLWNVDEESEVLRPHFNGLCDLLTKRAEQGLPLPDGIDPSKTYSQYRFVTIARRGKESRLIGD